MAFCACQHLDVPLMAGEVEKWGTKLTGQVRVPICRLRERSFNSLLFPKAGAYQSSPPIIKSSEGAGNCGETLAHCYCHCLPVSHKFPLPIFRECGTMSAVSPPRSGIARCEKSGLRARLLESALRARFSAPEVTGLPRQAMDGQSELNVSRVSDTVNLDDMIDVGVGQSTDQ